MHGQTTRMYKTLVEAYHTVLLRMRGNNLVLPAAMITALCGGAAVTQKAAAVDHTSPETRTWNSALGT